MISRINIPEVPLAERVRPKSLNEFFGQQEILGDGKPVRLMIERDNLSSFILWGPPGSGKTTIAKLIAIHTNSEFYQISAVSSGVKDIRSVIESASRNKSHFKRTILFIDEIHRFNKSQQDALLHSVESGLITLIGATTENPSFEIIAALRSRMRIFQLDPLSAEDLTNILNNALRNDNFLKSLKIKDIDYDYLIYLSSGDARMLLSIFEAAVTQQVNENEIIISKEIIDSVVQKKNIIYDKTGEEHYNLISAFIKSIRGSDPDAAIYWMARMIAGGEDPLFIARRMVVLASEDIGNASPNALLLAEAAFSAVEKVGMPEGRIILAQCAAYLASCPKSNASYMAIENAIQEVNNNPLYPVPLHLRNAPTKLMKDIGYGKDYKYAHSFEKNFVLENYLPENLKDKQFYFPSDNGQEKTLKDRLRSLWGDKKKYS